MKMGSEFLVRSIAFICLCWSIWRGQSDLRFLLAEKFLLVGCVRLTIDVFLSILIAVSAFTVLVRRQRSLPLLILLLLFRFFLDFRSIAIMVRVLISDANKIPQFACNLGIWMFQLLAIMILLGSSKKRQMLAENCERLRSDQEIGVRETPAKNTPSTPK
jgi:hypothetical protein